MSPGDAVAGRGTTGGRGLRRRSVVLAAPVLAALPGVAAAAPAGGGRFDPGDWSAVRAQFALRPDYAHFAAFVLSSPPRSVREAIASFRDRLDTFPEEFRHGVADLEYGARAQAALGGYAGAPPGEIALTDSATMAIGLVYGGLRLEPGDEVLTTPHEFYSTHESLRLRSAAHGVRVRQVALYDDPATASREEMTARLRRAVTGRTRVVALTWVHSGTGVKVPVRDVADALARVNAHRRERDRVLLCVDGVHGFAAEDVDVPALGADFFMTSAHKWLFGPRGTGFAWGSPAAWRRVDTAVPSFSAPAFTGWLTGRPPVGDPGTLNSPGGYHSFENRWALPEAVAFQRAIGRDRVAARVREQATRLKEGLAALPRVRLVTPRSAEVSAGVVCCVVDGVAGEEVVARLLAEHRISAGTTPYRESYVRFGPSIVTDDEEVDRLVRAMAAFG
ncbi:aminotransferase class V-fold PLP-dependent enzyme [Saccharothrix syringae]|nr:aminotransferase class V-fold PLP-dependent enzyme [Saccharothrix syringae]